MINVLDWFYSHYQEILGTVFSLIYLYFSIKQNIWLWPLGLISSAIYVYIFFSAGIYADMGLQVYYVVISIYGWYRWSKGVNKDKETTSLQVNNTDEITAVYLLIITSVLFIIISQFLINYTDSQIPYWDAFTTAASITATWMLAKKYIEHWLIWIVVDLVSTGLYVYKNLYFTVFLYAVYTSMAVVGYLQWKKSMLNE
ncbi:MAG: nicotinamide riboside transporter PnuC [Bacteroidales bacterium]|nr:nicotinamide riboside transporter PnuC [Bacteroidales bacterium]